MSGDIKPKTFRNNLYVTQEDSFVPIGDHVANTAIASGKIHWHIHWESVTDDGIVTAIA